MNLHIFNQLKKQTQNIYNIRSASHLSDMFLYCVYFVSFPPKRFLLLTTVNLCLQKLCCDFFHIVVLCKTKNQEQNQQNNALQS